MLGKPPFLVVCGTRPEAVKLSPVVAALRRHGHRVVLVATGQHRDLAPRMFNELGISPDAVLESAQAGIGPGQLLGSLVQRLSPLIGAYSPSMVLVQGDTVSSIAGALAAAYAGVPVGHIEAGLRTADIADPFPEEMHRRLVSPIASLHFAPTERAAIALRLEGVPDARIHVTGNTGIDALFATASRLDTHGPLDAGLERRFGAIADPSARLIVATVHRRENQMGRLQAIAAGLAALCRADGAHRIILPLHPNPEVRRPLKKALGGVRGIHLVEPLDHAAMVWLMRRAALLLTDSGGLQEEAPYLGLRTLVLRASTERPEAIEAGAAEIAPAIGDLMAAAAIRMLAMPKLAPVQPFGDGHAGERIAAILGGFAG